MNLEVCVFVGPRTRPCSPPPLLLTALREARCRLNRCDQLILCVYCAMKLGTIWKEAHSHFHGTCGVYPMQSVNINSPAHAFSCNIKEVWSEVMQRWTVHMLPPRNNNNADSYLWYSTFRQLSLCLPSIFSSICCLTLLVTFVSSLRFLLDFVSSVEPLLIEI